MSIRKWHPGKLVILWIWGGTIAGLLLTAFMTRPVPSSPITHLIELLTIVLILFVLTIITWLWLSGKEST
jgi:hypothetical protein